MVNKRPATNRTFSTVDWKRYQHSLAILHSWGTDYRVNIKLLGKKSYVFKSNGISSMTFIVPKIIDLYKREQNAFQGFPAIPR